MYACIIINFREKPVKKKKKKKKKTKLKKQNSL